MLVCPCMVLSWYDLQFHATTCNHKWVDLQLLCLTVVHTLHIHTDSEMTLLPPPQIVLTPRPQPRPSSVIQQHPPLGGQVALSLLSWVEWLVYWCLWCYWWWLCVGAGCVCSYKEENGHLRCYLSYNMGESVMVPICTALGLVSVCMHVCLIYHMVSEVLQFTLAK